MMISKSILFQSICVAVLAVVSAAGITLELDTIQVGLTDTVTTLRDNGTASVGDIYTWNTGNKIYATADPTALNGSPVVGENQGHCVRLTNAGADSMWDCTITIFLYDGQLECHGPFSTNTTQCVITGGRYVNTMTTPKGYNYFFQIISSHHQPLNL